MATPAHCIFCFEVLAASLDQREPVALRRVQELWEPYQPARLPEPEVEDDAEDLMEVDGEGIDEEEASDPDEDPIRGPISRLRPNRLSVPSPSSASSSSTPSSSTPSSMSTSSSRTAVSTLASSSNSSRSSLFSMRRPSRPPRPVEQDRPLFVTWSAISRIGHKSLRGCIGTFEAQPLESGLRNYALTSAFDDSRFMPIAKRELRNLEVGVTLLTDFETAPTPTSWTLGKHGLRISFTLHARRYGATYLPDVPVDQGWTKEETLISLMRKAGWTGRKDDWRKVADLRVVRYQGKKVTMKYDEWMSWRRWAEKSGLI